jgi:hypothetical protein
MIGADKTQQSGSRAAAELLYANFETKDDGAGTVSNQEAGAVFNLNS